MIYAVLTNGSKIIFNPQTMKFGADYNTVNFKPKYELDEHIRTKHPKTIKILLGNACNFRCKYCRQFLHDKKEKITKEKLDKFIELIKNNLDLSNLIKVEYWGGEPLLYWDEILYLKKFFDTVNPKCIHHMTTNGSLLNDDIYKNLIDGSNWMIKLSHDGPTQYLRTQDPIKLHSEMIYNLYKELTPRRLFFINSVLTTECYSPAKVVDYFKQEFGDPIQIMKMEPSIPYNIHSQKYTLTGDLLKKYSETFYNDLMTYDLLPSVQEYREMFNFFMVATNRPIHKYFTYNFAEGKCHWVQKVTLTVDLDGNLTPCQVYSKDDNKIGNIKDMDNINDELPLLVNRIKLCYDCPCVSMCRGTCPYFNNLNVISMNCNVRYQTYTTLLKYFCRITYGYDIDHFEGKFYHSGD